MSTRATEEASGSVDLERAALLERARTLGADLAGIASVADLRYADDVDWPEGARSMLVVAVTHPPGKPEMDWWFGRNDPPGNRILAGIVQGLCDWIPGRFGWRVTHHPYHVHRGGVYLKDAAVLAGLGCIGLSNLLITPEYGPCVRLRALTLDVDLPSTGPADFDPCAGCDAPCRAACPQGAFGSGGPARPVGSPGPARPRLPGRTGEFSRAACYVQMDLDVGAAAAAVPEAAASGSTASAAPAAEPMVKVIRYCRACELSCRLVAERW
ncbi:MAG: epoxyqueuosine reductase [Thermoleophilia bacterium]|nr:epoxyqueuosine reductase [Thermoleophilia bacterium]